VRSEKLKEAKAYVARWWPKERENRQRLVQMAEELPTLPRCANDLRRSAAKLNRIGFVRWAFDQWWFRSEVPGLGVTLKEMGTIEEIFSILRAIAPDANMISFHQVKKFRQRHAGKSPDRSRARFIKKRAKQRDKLPRTCPP
jgi:hypothetical protein